jgi:hypothetical protein
MRPSVAGPSATLVAPNNAIGEPKLVVQFSVVSFQRMYEMPLMNTVVFGARCTITMRYFFRWRMRISCSRSRAGSNTASNAKSKSVAP